MNTKGYYIKRTRMSDHSLEMQIFFFGLKCILDLLYLMLYDWHSVFLFWQRNAIILLKTNSNRKNNTFSINISIIEIHVNNDILEALEMFENGSMILIYVNINIHLNTNIYKYKNLFLMRGFWLYWWSWINLAKVYGIPREI